MPPMPPPAIRTGRSEEVCEGVVGAPDMPRLSMQWRAELVADVVGAVGWEWSSATGPKSSYELASNPRIFLPVSGLDCI